MNAAIRRVNDAAVACALKGKTPARAFIGADAFVEVLNLFGNHIRWASPDTVTMHTPAGPLLLSVRVGLHESVIVEAEDGEPFIVEPRDDLEAA